MKPVRVEYQVNKGDKPVYLNCMVQQNCNAVELIGCETMILTPKEATALAVALNRAATEIIYERRKIK